jgi:hypothetical protein
VPDVSFQLLPHLHVRSHLLQILDDNQIRIHEAINTVLHTRLFASVQFARGNLAGDAFAETGIGEGVDSYLLVSKQHIEAIKK